MRQLRAQQMLRGELAGKDLDEFVEERLVFTTLETAQNWARKNCLFPLGFGLACCAIEMITVIGSPRNDLARFGAEAIRFTPRQADLLILSGPRVDQDGPDHPPALRPDARAEVGDRDGRLLLDRRHVQQLRGGRRARTSSCPIDIYVPGCPPRPEALDLRDHEAAGQDHGQPGHGLARALHA